MTHTSTWSGDPAAPSHRRAAPGTTIGGRYALRAAVGHGGMGTVWRATDTLLGRDVAIKEVILPPGLAASDREAMYERTLREARAAAALQHPAVVQVYDVVTDDGRPWIVMELLDARSLGDMVLEDGPLAPRAVAKIGIALLGALEVAHAAGILHRDVKPANVLICSDGRCVLTDFGVARMPTDVQLTTPGMVLGSPHFISPERAMGREFGPPSDLFSLGVTLYTAVEGRPPFDKGDPIETMRAVVEEPPAPATRAGVLLDVLNGLLEKDPARRLDVVTAREKLRSLLAGPLASKAPAPLVTDPYSVVPAQRSAWQPAEPVSPAAPAPTGQVGGRAMLRPGESITDRLAQLQQAQQPSAPAQPSTTYGQPPAGYDQPTATQPPAPYAPPASGYGQPSLSPAQPPISPGQPGIHGQPGGGFGPATAPFGSPGGGQGHRAGVYGARSGPSGTTPGALLDKAIGDIRRAAASVVATVKGWPARVQIAAAGGLAVVVLLGAVLLFVGSDDDQKEQPVQAASPSAPAGPDFEVETYAGRGLSVNVPKGWKKNAPKGAVYVDFTDPEQEGRRVRILVEKSSAEPLNFLDQAGNRLDKNASSCARPYNEIGLREVELAGKPAAELEYTCGEGEGMRHGIWRAVTHDGRTYSFYLSTTDADFADSKKFYDEMVRSFQLTDAG